MADCLQQSDFEGLRSGALTHDERARIESHLRGCEACSHHASQLLQNNNTAAGGMQSVRASTQMYSGSSRSEALLPVLDGYEIMSEIHRGGQGIVYKALQKSTNRIVAIKVLPHEYSATDRQKRRFEREVALASNLHHPNIVTIYDSGLSHGRYYFVMEYVHGQPLDAYIKSNQPDVRTKLELFVTICDAVNDAHRQGITHRDLKPGNILVDSRGQPHVVDFGLAKGAVSGVLEGKPVSMTSEFMGTLAYAAPEQTRGDPSLVDARTDVYALGVVLFEMVTGQLPYPVGGDVVRAFEAIRETPPSKPSRFLKKRFQDLDTVIHRALAKEPLRRYQTVADFGRDVQHILADKPVEARRDSAAYVLRMRSRAMLVRYPLARTLAVSLAVTALVVIGADVLFMLVWNKPMHWFEQAWTQHFAPPLPDHVFDQVRIVAMNADTHAEIERIAASEQLEGVTTDVPRSLRRMHGRLFEKLAAAKRAGADIKAVVFDMFIGPPSNEEERAYTADLIRGVRELQSAGIQPIFPLKLWIDQAEDPPAQELIDAKVLLGGVTLMATATMPWKLDVAAERDDQVVLGLPLLALAQALQPALDVAGDLSAMQNRVRLHFSQQGRATSKKSVRLSYVINYVPESDDVEALAPGDEVGSIFLQLPNDQAIDRATIPYHDLYAADADELARLVNGKVLVLGDIRPGFGEPPLETPDGRELCGVHAHATAIDALLSDRTLVRYGNAWQYWFALVVAGFVGAVVGGRTLRLGSRILMVLVGCALIVAISMASLRLGGLLINPVFPIVVLLLSTIVATLLRRAQPAHLSPQLSRRLSS